MTPNFLLHRVPGAVRWLMGGLAAIAFAGAAIPVQAATATLTGVATNTCTYTSASVDGNGNLTVTCNTTPQPGQIAFQQATYSANVNNASFNVAVVRNVGTSGAVGATVTASGGCTVAGGASTTVSFADGSNTAQNLVIGTPATATTCTLALSAATGGATLGANAAINVIDPTQPGTFAWAAATSSTTVGTTNHLITISRLGGSNGEYDVVYGVVSGTGTTLTGANVTPNPVKFLTGETSKTITFTAGTTAGTISFNFPQAPIPVAPNVTPTTASGTHQVTVSAVSGCPTPGANVTVVATPSPNTGTSIFGLSPGKIVAIPMPVGTPNISLINGLRVFNTSQTDASLTTTFVLAQCPGDVQDSWPNYGVAPCRKQGGYTGNLMDLRADPPPLFLGVPQWAGKCGWYTSERANQWYMNIRVDNCNSGNCSLMYQINSTTSTY